MATKAPDRTSLAEATATTRDNLRALFRELPEPRNTPTPAWTARVNVTLDRFADLVEQGGSADLLTSRELAEAQRHVIAALRVKDRSELSLADQMSQVMLAMEAVRHVFRDASDEQRPGPDTRTSTLMADLSQWLPSISHTDLAALLDVTTKTLQRWSRDDSPPTNDRLLIVHRLVAVLSRSWTPAGVLAWFDRPRTQLQGATPRKLLNDPARQHELIELALAGRRSQGA
ncbi:MAG: hypothetical protein QM679_12360 [Patulibacter sp.]